MKSINVYEVGVDPLPIVGLEICYWKQSYSFGFVSDEIKFSIVQSALPNGVDTLVLDDVFIDEIDWSEGEGDIFDDFGYPTKPLLYTEYVEEPLQRGMTWMYYHDYINAIGSDIFPFQEEETIVAAINSGIVNEISRETVLIKKNSIGENRPPCDLYYTDIVVEYLGEKVKLSFSSANKDKVFQGRCFSLDKIED